jgi:hypothetical protein
MSSFCRRLLRSNSVVIIFCLGKVVDECRDDSTLPVPVLPTCHCPTSVYTLYEYRQPQPLSLKTPIPSTRSGIPIIKWINQASARRPTTTDPSDVRLQVRMPCISQSQHPSINPSQPPPQHTHSKAQHTNIPTPPHPIQNAPVGPNPITELIVH